MFRVLEGRVKKKIAYHISMASILPGLIDLPLARRTFWSVLVRGHVADVDPYLLELSRAAVHLLPVKTICSEQSRD